MLTELQAQLHGHIHALMYWKELLHSRPPLRSSQPGLTGQGAHRCIVTHNDIVVNATRTVFLLPAGGLNVSEENESQCDCSVFIFYIFKYPKWASNRTQEQL